MDNNLEEIIFHLSAEISELNHKVEAMSHQIIRLNSAMNSGFTELPKDMVEIREVVNFIGNKVFDSQERRLVALEAA